MSHSENTQHTAFNSELQEQQLPVTPSVASEPATDQVKEIEKLLGGFAVLLPVPHRQKGPSIKGWQKLTLKDTQTQEYQNQLRAGNVGVLLGLSSNGLCTVDIDDDDAVKPFLDLNPKLQNTLRTVGHRGAQLWFVLEDDEYPKLSPIQTADGEKWGELRSTGGQSIIHGTHPEGMPYQMITRAQPVRIKFDQIKWPEKLKLPWIKTEYDLLVEEEGEPFIRCQQGRIKGLNDMFWVSKFGREHTVLYDSKLREFYLYQAETGLWRRATEETIKNTFLRDLAATADELREPALRLKRTNATASNWMNLLKGHVERYDAFAGKGCFAHVKNGVIRLDQSPIDVVTFSPEFYSRNRAPFDYVPDAKCERFVNELLKTALDDDDILLLQKWSGSVLLGRNPAQKILLMIGTAGGGKSTFTDVLERVIGRDNVTQLRTEHLAERFELFRFDGKTLLTGKDVPPTFLMSKGSHVLKALVGNDLLSAEKKGSVDEIQFKGDFNVAITSNSKLRVKLEGDTDAWHRRLLVVTYNRQKPAKPIADFATELIDQEGPGILKWMIDGASLYLQDLEKYGTIQLTQRQKDRIDMLLAESDSIRKFVENGVVVEEGQSVTCKELLQGYQEYCDRMEWEGYSQNDVQRRIPELMREIYNARQSHDIMRPSGNQRGYRNFSLVTGE